MSNEPAAVSKMSDRERAIRKRLRDDFEHYAGKALRIQSKAAEIVPFRLNAIQRKVHERLEAQLSTTGMVRALILKARKPGISTYIGGRFFHKVTHKRGLNAFILTHEQPATDTLFAMVDRFYRNLPPLVKPHVGASNAKELYFDLLDSGYRIGTARVKDTGRSQTIHLFHGSEVAYWTNAASHMAGALQAVPKESPGTEVVLESTGNGIGGLFYGLAKAAVAGDSSYELIFLPWFESSEYVKTPPPGWTIPPKWAEYQDAHQLTKAQLYFAYTANADLAVATNSDMEEPCPLFRQEYPATIQDAFQSTTRKSFIADEYVSKARTTDVGDQSAFPIVLGADISGGINDKTWIIDRQGRKYGGHINDKFKEKDQMVIAGRLARHIDTLRAKGLRKCFIDVGGGYGSGVYDRLRELGYSEWVLPVNFGWAADNSRDYANKRAEMWGGVNDDLKDPGGCEMPDDDELHSHLTSCGWKHNSKSQIVLESKEDIKDRLGFSPDGGDACGLTHAYAVAPLGDDEREGAGKGHWMGA